MISKLIKDKKRMELLQLKKMTPQERLKVQVRLNTRVKKLFFAGKSSMGFTHEEIVRLWKSKRAGR